jgi:DNA-binding LacI/PurR family transcriptional regulator
MVLTDDVHWAKFVDPPLAMPSQPTERFGAVATELFWERQQGRTKSVVRILRPSLVVQDSSATKNAEAWAAHAPSGGNEGGVAGRA